MKLNETLKIVTEQILFKTEFKDYIIRMKIKDEITDIDILFHNGITKTLNKTILDCIDKIIIILLQKLDTTMNDIDYGDIYSFKELLERNEFSINMSLGNDTLYRRYTILYYELCEKINSYIRRFRTDPIGASTKKYLKINILLFTKKL
jgi:hypothetical protein